MTVKDKIIDLRIRSGLTQEQFAEKANIDLEQLKAVENGDRLPDEEMRACQIFVEPITHFSFYVGNVALDVPQNMR